MRGLTRIAAACLIAAPLAKATVIDFETPTDYANNFRKVAAITPLQTTGQPNNYLYFHASTSASNTSSLIYDTTPGDATAATASAYSVSAGSPLSVTTDVSFPTNNSSFGVYIVDASNEANGYLALFNVNASGFNPNDQIRFASNAIPNGSGSTNAGTLNTPGKTSADAVALATLSTIDVTYSIDADNHPVLTLTANPGAANAYSDSITFSSITTPLTTVEVGYRLSAQSGNTNEYQIDNVTLDGTPAPTPEPATALAACALAPAMLFARRRRARS
jgi:hypothetical protein